MQNPPALIAFDYDGTMADTEEITLPDFWAFLKEEYGIILSREEWIEHYHGMAGPRLLDMLNARYGTSMEWPAFIEKRTARLPELFARLGVPAAPGLHGVLATLHHQGIPYCICTNSNAARNTMALTHMQLPSEDIRAHLQAHCFSAVEDGRASKPAPDVYLHALKKFDVNAADCIAIEDTVAGLSAAVTAGYTALGYVGLSRNPQHDIRILTEAGAAATFDHWDAFLPLLETLRG